MKLTIAILILLIAPLQALPKWFPASQGAVLKEAETRAEMDKKLAEYDKQLLAMSATIEELKPNLPVLEYMAKNNLELTASNLEVARANTVNAERSGDFIGAIVKAVATGDPMAMLSVVSLGAGLLGLGSGHSQKKKAQGFRAKALKYAHLDATESRAALKEDSDFPDVIA